MTMELLIVCPECSSARVSKAIDREAPLNWNEQDKIQLLTVPDRRSGDSPFVTGRILKHLSRQSNLTSIIAIDAKIELNKLIGRAIVQTPPGILVFERRVLPQTLKALKLDWLSEMDYKLRNGWHHGAIDRQYLEKWTKQFERLGGHGWVASGLLKVLDFWSDTRIREALRIEETGLSAFDCVAVNRHK